jgi:LuxR family quorum sensing-dependent transcriptional regulator
MPILAKAVFDLVDRIAAAATVSGVWDAYFGAARAVGLPFGAAAFYPPDEKEPPRIITDGLPANWMREYYDQGLGEGDLLTPRARQSQSSFEWRMTDWNRATLTAPQQRWYDHNIATGLLGGLIIKDFRRGENMVLLVCGHDGVLETHDRLALYFAGQEAMLRLREMAVPDYAPLSRRERECLQWAAAGKTDWEIGRILSLSDKTVNIYIERAKTKFGTNTRAKAIVMALQGGLIAA